MTDLLHFTNKHLQHTIVRDSLLLSPVIKHLNPETGEIPRSKKVDKFGKPIFREPYYHSTYKSLTINYTSKNRLVVKGSFHKYWNEGIHNYNDFSEAQAKETLNSFCNLFQIPLDVSYLKGYEVGINIKLPFEPKIVLDNCFIHLGVTPEMKYDSRKGHYIQFEHSQYIVKIYNKSLHYQSQGLEVEDNIIRFEIKFKKMEILNRMDIYTLQDLQDFPFINFKNYLLKKWDEVLMFDTTFTPQHINQEKYQHIKTWKEYLNDNSRFKLKYHRKKYQDLALIHSQKRKELIRKLIEDKIDVLTR